MDAGTLHVAIAEVCPVISTRVVKEDDRSTWSFEPEKNATAGQIAKGNDVIKTIPVDFKRPPQPEPTNAALYDHENRLRSLEGKPTISLTEFMTKTKTKTK
jgi:hypothetical protein